MCAEQSAGRTKYLTCTDESERKKRILALKELFSYEQMRIFLYLLHDVE